MKLKSLFLLLVPSIFSAQNQYLTPYEQGNGNQTVTYDEMVKYYEKLDRDFKTITVESFGSDDNGEPIRVVVFNSGKGNNNSLLINNGIHPGEPDGIDATMMLMRDLALGKINAGDVKIAAVQAYNISGMMRRGKFSRANQNGPEEYGFRGNARNYDLNRDFIKNDTENAKAFQQIFHHYKPIYFIDNHVSNGADYQYTFTYITTNKERLGEPLGKYFNFEMQPKLLQRLEEQNILTIPYVNIHGDVPDGGFPAFMDTPRYATGYTTLFNTLGTVAETHMLKPYNERVKATYEYMVSSLNYLSQHADEIKRKMSENRKNYGAGKKYTIQWKLDSTQYQLIDFKGYEAGYKPSEVTGKPRLFYDRNKPFTKKVKFFNTYKPTKEIVIPRFYIVPKSEKKVLEHLKRNKIQMKTISRDSVVNAEVYNIVDFKTVSNPYEGHYLHYDTQVRSERKNMLAKKGDFLIPTDQDGIKYLLETLEPEATDSFFNWNFFDAILGQKEYYSDYVFEDTAAELLKTNKALKTAFEMEKIANPEMAKDTDAQLNWIYKNSEYYEGTVRRYPILRIL